MELETILRYFTEYGPFAIFVIVLLEYLNLPGFPAGVIMSLADMTEYQFLLSIRTGGKCGAYASKKYGIPVVFAYHTRFEAYLHYVKPLEGL